jgi:DNA topoisomerase I
MDIRRIKSTDNFIYIYNKTKKRVNKGNLKRIKSLRIPPSYKKVKISSNKNSKVQVIGVDDLGRKQYIYNPKFIEEQQEIKFQDLINFGKKIKRIRKDYKKIIESDLSVYNKNKIISLILYLLDQCRFRIGSEEYKKKYNTYGATTINPTHITFKDNEVEIKFIGKKSIENTSIIKSSSVKVLLQELCKRNKGKDFLFYYKDQNDEINNINAVQVSTYLKKYHKDLMPKMFRTWNGNSILIKYLISKGVPINEKEIKKHLREAIKKVAFELHNTVSVSKKSYCNSEIYTTYLDNNEQFFKFIDMNRKENGEKKSTDRILNLFLEKYYKNLNNEKK